MAKAAVSSLAAKLGKAGLEAFDEHKDDEIVISGGGSECPVIPNGVAQLVDIHVGEYGSETKMAGKPFAYLAGTVVSPKLVFTQDGSKVPAAGCRTSLMFPLCNTTNSKGEISTLSQNYGKFLNELRKLGLETKDLKGDQIDAAIAALVESAPFFSFGTTLGKATDAYPNPRMFHNWGLAIEGYESDIDPDAGVKEEATETATPAKKTATTTKPATGGAGKKPPVKGAATVEEVPFGDDLDMTGDKADKGDEDAKTFLTEKARELGCTDEEIENTADWGEVVTMIRDKESGDDAAVEEDDYESLAVDADSGDQAAGDKISTWASENNIDVNDHGDKSWADFVVYVKKQMEGEGEEELTPEKGNVYETTLPGTKKPTQVEVLAVFPDKQLVNVKNLTDGKSHKSIPWASLTEVS